MSSTQAFVITQHSQPKDAFGIRPCQAKPVTNGKPGLYPKRENDEYSKNSLLVALRVGVEGTPHVAMSQQQSQRSVQTEAELLDKLTAYHAERGTTLDPQPRVNGKQINLYKLFYDVVDRGGYDVVSAEKLAWRKIGHEFGLGSANAAAYAFLLKSVYYNNLAAYEIKTIHNREPPPVEILEDRTAKGGDLLNRTLENYPRSSGGKSKGQDSDVSGDDVDTPDDDRMDTEEPGSGGRTTRGLRQAPPQRVLFQPDLTSSRQTRLPSGNHQSPQPAGTPASSFNNFNTSDNAHLPSRIDRYEPRPPMPLTLRGVTTPGNNPQMFKEHQRQLRDRALAALGRAPAQSTKGMMKPGQGFDGPNIYVRTLQGLRCPIPAEQSYALHHLCKISHERGDKYKFEAFPNLAESLIDHVLRVSSLFYDVVWDIDYFDGPHEINILDGINGTPDILQRIKCLKRRDPLDGLETYSYSECLKKVNEAGLTIRNLALLEDNAIYLSSLPQTRDCLAIVLSLPAHPDVTELKHYALDITEQVIKYWSTDPDDAVYQCLIKLLDKTSDRGIIITALRALSRISMNLENSNNLLGIPVSVVERILNWTLLQDEELVNTCLDFLYQFTAVPANVALLLRHSDDLSTPSYISHFTHLLQHGARPVEHQVLVHKAIRAPPPTDIVDLPQDLLQEFLTFEEPVRSTHWLKACFEEDVECEVTQIALWQAYQARFSAYAPEKPLLQAAEFIKNVSVAFNKANAHVAANKYIMKGIRPRRVPVDTTGRPYLRCLWTPPGQSRCGQFFMGSKNMWEHVIGEHLKLSKDADGDWDVSTVGPERLDCHWGGCRRFTKASESPTVRAVGNHIKGAHLPHEPSTPRVFDQYSTRRSEAEVIASGIDQPAVYRTVTNYPTSVNERGEATGLPLTSLYVLRNIARNIPKAFALLEAGPSFNESGPKKDSRGWVRRLFGSPRWQFFNVIAINAPMADHVTDLLCIVDKNSE